MRKFTHKIREGPGRGSEVLMVPPRIASREYSEVPDEGRDFTAIGGDFVGAHNGLHRNEGRQMSPYKILAHIWCKVSKKCDQIGFASVRRLNLLTAP